MTVTAGGIENAYASFAVIDKVLRAEFATQPGTEGDAVLITIERKDGGIQVRVNRMGGELEECGLDIIPSPATNRLEVRAVNAPGFDQRFPILSQAVLVQES